MAAHGARASYNEVSEADMTFVNEQDGVPEYRRVLYTTCFLTTVGDRASSQRVMMSCCLALVRLPMIHSKTHVPSEARHWKERCLRLY
jgi:hypothetical protein